MDGYDKLNTGVGYLVINTTGSYDDWSNVYSGGFDALDLAPAENDGEWLAHNLIGTGLPISFSVCFSAFTAQNAITEATTPHNRTEPVLG